MRSDNTASKHKKSARHTKTPNAKQPNTSRHVSEAEHYLPITMLHNAKATKTVLSGILGPNLGSVADASAKDVIQLGPYPTTNGATA